MCKKLTKLVKDGEAMKEELAKYRSLYGDVDATLTVEEVRTRGRRSARTTSSGFLGDCRICSDVSHVLLRQADMESI